MTRVLVGAAAVAVVLAVVHATGQSQAVQSAGTPLPGITATEFSEFRLGLDDFTEVETAEEGLGPAYIAGFRRALEPGMSPTGTRRGCV